MVCYIAENLLNLSRCNGGRRSTFAGNTSGLLPSKVRDFALLPALRFWWETVSLSTKIYRLFRRGLSKHLTVNSTKTQALSVGPCDYSLFLNNARIELLKSIKILGVTLDKDLSYKEHISGQLKKAYAKASALRTVRGFLPRDAMIKLYKAFILPHIEYCSPLFAGIGIGQRNRLEDGNCYILRSLIAHNKLMSYDEAGAPTDGFLLNALKTLCRLSRVLLDL